MNTLEKLDRSRSTATRHRRTVTVAALAALLTVVPVGFYAVTTAGAQDQKAVSPGGDRNVLPLEYDGPIKAVLQVTKDETEGGVHKALFTLKKMYGSYVAAGIDPQRLDLRAVFHGDAADHLLSDDAWNRWRKTSGGNPSSKIIAELTRLGVHIELCNSRRVQNKWSKDDVHPDVLLAPNAYQRLIDLQLRGYAYLRY